MFFACVERRDLPPEAETIIDCLRPTLLAVSELSTGSPA